MADALYLNLWFPSFETEEIPPRLLSVLKEFPFSAARPGIGYVAVQPISWTEPTIFEETYDFRTDPENAVAAIREHLNDDYAYELEAAWDIWSPVEEGGLDTKWVLQPQVVTFTAHAKDFEEGGYQQQGHIQIDFGLDIPFIHEELGYSQEVERYVKSNVQKLVSYTQALERNIGITGRLLWSESEENLAQKLIARLQKVQ